MPKKKAREPSGEELLKEALDFIKEVPKKKKGKKISPVFGANVEPVSKKTRKVKGSEEVAEKQKPKPKPITKKLPVKPLEIYELAALYEHLCRDTVTDNYRTWPDITIAEARELVKGIDPSDLSPLYAKMYRNEVPVNERHEDDVRSGARIIRYGYKDVREFRNAVIEKEIYVGMSIPLFVEHFSIEKDDPVMLTLLFSWAAHVKAMIELRKKQGNTKSRSASSVADGDFCIEIECNAEQALLLERYCAAYHGTLIACRDYLKSLGSRAPKRIDKISSKLATQIRKEQCFEDVPRSLIVSALNGYAYKIKFNRSKEFEKEIGKFYLKDNFKFGEDSLTVGKAKDIAITKVIAGQRYDIPVIGVSFVRISPLKYEVTILHDKGSYYLQKYS